MNHHLHLLANKHSYFNFEIFGKILEYRNKKSLIIFIELLFQLTHGSTLFSSEPWASDTKSMLVPVTGMSGLMKLAGLLI